MGFVAQNANPPPKPIEPGVRIGHVRVARLTAEPARARVKAAFERPVHFVFHKKRWTATPHQLGARAAAGVAVTHALKAPPRTRIRLEVAINGRKLRRYVAGLNKRLSRPAKDTELAGFTSDLRPILTEARPGRRVARDVMVRRIEKALKSGDRDPIRLVTRMVDPQVTEATFGPIIVIRRDSHRLALFNGESAWQTFGVATGSAQYPTPTGLWSIADMQRDPWWRPPPSDWAKGLKPIPPGPGNPLGTRWMGLSAPAVGIHATPDAASIGYSVSHGCIRMHQPDAEWLFENVRIGTPVYIAAA
jgi:lipoprotein-anchoring transpeptidase ErfK/SrfK